MKFIFMLQFPRPTAGATGLQAPFTFQPSAGNLEFNCQSGRAVMLSLSYNHAVRYLQQCKIGSSALLPAVCRMKQTWHQGKDTLIVFLCSTHPSQYLIIEVALTSIRSPGQRRCHANVWRSSRAPVPVQSCSSSTGALHDYKQKII